MNRVWRVKELVKKNETFVIPLTKSQQHFRIELDTLCIEVTATELPLYKMNIYRNERAKKETEK